MKRWQQITNVPTMTQGVPEYFGEDARILRKVIRSMEDCLEDMGFDQLMSGPLVSHQIFLNNLEYLGKRFMDNLVYSQVNGENGSSVLLPEGTMKSYDFIRRSEMKKAKVFYSAFFTRNEDPVDVSKGKTRCFWQIGFEIFNHPIFQSSIEAINATYSLLISAGLDDAYIRITDKRILKGLIESYSEKDREIIMSIIDKADDSSSKFRELYSVSGGESKSVVEDITELLEMISVPNQDILSKLKGVVKKSKQSQEGIDNISRIQEKLGNNVTMKIIPFMAKSWDACDKLMFDGRYPGYDSAICGGGNLTYNGYRPDSPKSGVGVGVTRVFDIIKSKMF
ncbi:ATP phosphoribosyltransferase regulatory subunit [Candidatus Gracilibacteria bacterium]|nr:ATP phosphoribosyltransferase regulatory subunit [Candidatus Gracilibacteria bacterium]